MRPRSLQKEEGKKSLESWILNQKGARGRCDLPPKQVTFSLPWDAHLEPWRASLKLLDLSSSCAISSPFQGPIPFLVQIIFKAQYMTQHKS